MDLRSSALGLLHQHADAAAKARFEFEAKMQNDSMSGVPASIGNLIMDNLLLGRQFVFEFLEEMVTPDEQINDLIDARRKRIGA